jgi:uncharacterized protein (DUF488 family)
MDPMSTDERIIHTVGHSSLAVADFARVLSAHGIRALADVRSYPASRRHPQFAREALSASLAAAGVDYRWFPALGGRRAPRRGSPHVGLRADGFRGYADHMETGEFEGALAELLEWAGERPSAVMCAERLWRQCHRRLLSDRLATRGVSVVHLLDETGTEPHRLTECARLEADRLIYDGGMQAELPLEA